MSTPLLLLVDDSPEMGVIVGSLGRRAGWDVKVERDAEAAWNALAERKPDLVLLDVNLPGVSGLEWLRRARRTPEHADLTAALYTHWGLPADVAAGLDAGVDFVFDKDLATRPADWQRRLSEIRQIGRNRQAPGAWTGAASSPTMEASGRPGPPLETWAAAFRKALRHSSLRRLTREVLPAVWRRALTQALGPRILPPPLGPGIEFAEFDSEGFPLAFASASPAGLALCLAEQMERLLGSEAAAAFRRTLAADPDVREFLS
jgi:CheY-like chemotaxis protein